MRIARFDGGRLGVVVGQSIVDVTAIASVVPAEWPPVGINRVIASWDQMGPAFAAGAKDEGVPLGDVRLETPIPWPHKLLAMPNNFAAHGAEMKLKNFAGNGTNSAPADEAGFFMKSAGSLSGPADPILLPDRPDREFHYECELATIVGRGGKDIAVDDALDHIFGYSCLIDVTMRGAGERVMRKSFDTFTPVGPWITTSDEVGAPDDLELNLWLNGELRQHAVASDMVVGIREQIALCSSVTRLEPGDIIASGTMAGVGKLAPGDEVKIEISRVGKMVLTVGVPVRA